MIGVFKKLFHCLQRFVAKIWRAFFPSLIVIGVTGSYGKTNTVRAIKFALGKKFTPLTTDINLDTVFNLPLTLLKIRPQNKALILEYGVDHRGEMEAHLRLIRPQIGVLTGISPVHAEKELLGSLSGIIEEKGELLEALPKTGWAVLNFANPHVRQMAKKTEAKIVSYGQKDADFWLKDTNVELGGTSFLVGLRQGGKEKEVRVKTKLIGRHFGEEIMAALAVAKILGIKEKEAAQNLEKLTPLPGRMSLEKGPKDTLLLNDSLRANPASTSAGLKTLAEIPYRGRKIAVLGEMGELGQYQEKEHRLIGQKLTSLDIDFFVGIGNLTHLIWEEAINNGFAKKRAFWAKDVVEAAQILEKLLKKGDLWYLKGSRLRHLERILLLLNHETVDCRLISCHNYDYCQQCPALKKQ